MSCNYADGLSPYENKGVLGLPEKFDSIDKLNEKCKLLAKLITSAGHVVVHTGAGISTSAGIPDFRGPNGVWTLEKEGKKPTTDISFTEAKPTKTHMILKKLVECDKIQYIVSQNIDGLHLKSGLPRRFLAELHGNMFVEECNVCKNQFVRSAPVETVGKKSSGVPCGSGILSRRPCRGRLHDGVLDWDHSLPECDLVMAECHSSIADLSICLGTTLQIVPSGNLPLETVKYGGKLVICNLQPTKHDNKADLIINHYVDDILERVMDILGIEIPTYNEQHNPTILAKATSVSWTIDRKDIVAIEKKYKSKCKGVKKIRNLIKIKRNSKDFDDVEPSKSKISKLNVKDEQLNNSTDLDINCIKNELKSECTRDEQNEDLNNSSDTKSIPNGIINNENSLIHENTNTTDDTVNNSQNDQNIVTCSS